MGRSAPRGWISRACPRPASSPPARPRSLAAACAPAGSAPFTTRPLPRPTALGVWRSRKAAPCAEWAAPHAPARDAARRGAPEEGPPRGAQAGGGPRSGAVASAPARGAAPTACRARRTRGARTVSARRWLGERPRTSGAGVQRAAVPFRVARRGGGPRRVFSVSPQSPACAGTPSDPLAAPPGRTWRPPGEDAGGQSFPASARALGARGRAGVVGGAFVCAPRGLVPGPRGRRAHLPPSWSSLSGAGRGQRGLLRWSGPRRQSARVTTAQRRGDCTPQEAQWWRHPAPHSPHRDPDPAAQGPPTCTLPWSGPFPHPQTGQRWLPAPTVRSRYVIPATGPSQVWWQLRGCSPCESAARTQPPWSRKDPELDGEASLSSSAVPALAEAPPPVGVPEPGQVTSLLWVEAQGPWPGPLPVQVGPPIPEGVAPWGGSGRRHPCLGAHRAVWGCASRPPVAEGSQVAAVAVVVVWLMDAAPGLPTARWGGAATPPSWGLPAFGAGPGPLATSRLSGSLSLPATVHVFRTASFAVFFLVWVLGMWLPRLPLQCDRVGAACGALVGRSAHRCPRSVWSCCDGRGSEPRPTPPVRLAPWLALQTPAPAAPCGTVRHRAPASQPTGLPRATAPRHRSRASSLPGAAPTRLRLQGGVCCSRTRPRNALP